MCETFPDVTLEIIQQDDDLIHAQKKLEDNDLDHKFMTDKIVIVDYNERPEPIKNTYFGPAPKDDFRNPNNRPAGRYPPKPDEVAA